ncbi:hypothetical protein SLEP1_g10528 [Rubroshorea leprosula]|uniref:Disease resistance N-terminal domain-containing protein n=1 Tax=Rubroshorea leprosula TaxID=152421 RepID=A0AAV5IIA7_9ROSI|nr:hypothetical protein SLEP1_g10528 [Rubroshorea leprosula]
MQTELRLMQCFLKDVDKRHDGDESVRNWVSEIREAAYYIEAVIQSFPRICTQEWRNPLPTIKGTAVSQPGGCYKN